MNKIYKVIWSKVKHCYIVVSELAKNCTKSSKFCSLNSVLENNILLSLCNSAVCSPVFNTNIVVPTTVTNLDIFKNIDDKSFKITVAAIVKNEAKNVPQWVASARSCADEIIVVDTGSTDDTVQRFADYGITCYHYDWDDDFASAKNYMISLCHGDWIVLLDGDEWFREGCDVRKAIAKHHNNPVEKAIIADWICLDTTRNNTIMFSGGAVRAFRNSPEIRYFRKVHENLTIKYENFVFEPDFKLYHTGYSGDVNRSKHERNLRIMRTMFDFDNGKVEYPTDWRYVQDTYAGLGEFQKSLDASDKMLAYGVSDYSAPSWITRFNVLFAMKAPIERMNREFDYCFKTVPSVSGFRFLAAIYYFRNGFVSNALENYIEGIRLLMGPQDSTAMQHTYWRMYMPEASALASAVYLQNKQVEAALYVCKVSEQYCGKSLWTDNALHNVHCVLTKDVSFNFVDFPNNFLSILTFAKKAVLTTALASFITVGIFPVSVSAGCIIGGTNHYQAEGYSVLVGGSNNTSLCSYGVIIGGSNHRVNGSYGAVVGGVCNQVFDSEGSILGGCNNHTGFGYWYTVDGTTPIYVRSTNVDIQGDKINVGGTYYQLYSIDGDYATVVGGSSNLAAACQSFVGGGHTNFAVACYASVVGGEDNVASGSTSSVFGGVCNLAQGNYSIVVGGCNNVSSVCYAVVVGGKSGISSACHSAVFGGGHNTASCQGAVTVGGSCNTSNSSHSLVAGGICNISNGYYSVVIGGSCNSANSDCSVVVGGHCGQTFAGRSVSIGGGITGVSTCSATAQYSVAIGQNAMTTKNYEVAIGSSCAPVTIGGCGSIAYAPGSVAMGGGVTGTSACQYAAEYSIAIGKCANTTKKYEVAIGSACSPVTIGGNMTVIGTNTVTDGTTTKSWSDLLNSSTSGSSGGSSTTGLPGCNNTASGCYSYVSGGCHNTASGNKSSVSGGDHNIASGQTSSIIGGYCNTASGIDTSILGGYTNSATCTGASVSGGCLNVASGVKSSVSGGQCNSASGELSWVAGGCCGNAYAIYSSVIGGGTTGVSTSQYTAMGSVAIGRGAITTSNYEVAIGSADAPVTIGGNVTVKGTNTITDGTTTKTWSDVLNASGGTPYTLPAATSSTLGGVKVGSNITNSSGTISLTKANVTTALGYTPPTADTDTHYTTHLYAGSGTATNASTTNGNTKITLADDSIVRNSVTVKGSGATTVTSDANGVITISSTDNNTTYSAATSSAAGLMSAADKSKLDGIASGANAYTLPAATASALGGVKIGSNITNSNGTISLTKDNVTAALGYTPPTADTNTHYTSHMYVGSGTAANASTTNGNTKIALADDSTVRNTLTIKGTGATTVTSDANGVITINSTDNNTTYSAATQSANGLMTAADKKKLDGIATGANAYTLPAATSSALGGVKIGSNITNSDGTISLTKANVTAALGYTPPTTDTNTTYDNMSASELSTGTATTARSISAKTVADYVIGKVSAETTARTSAISSEATTRANADTALGTRIDGTIKDLSVSGRTITYTKGDGTTGTITTQDTNTTYSAATSSALGLVKTGANITNSSGTISLTKDNVTAALGYTPPTQDTNTTYAAMSASEASTGTATTARSITAKVLADYVGEKVNDAKNGTITGLSISGKTITYTKGDGSTGTLTTQDNNTTYDNMSASELSTGTATTARSISAKVVSDYVKTKTDDKITGLSVNGKVITYTKGDGTTGTITTQDTNTTYSAATNSALGLVKTGANITNSSGTISLTKDNVVAALGYTPPTTDTNTTYSAATSSALGLVKIGSNITNSSGTISLTKANVTAALGYTPPTADTNTTYAAMSADELTTGTATTSRTMTAKVVSDYVKAKTDDKITGLSVNGKVITYTKGDGTTGTITTQDTNTTYSAATSSALGLVKTGANITNSSGTISLTKDNVVAALGYTPPTTDTNTTYAAMSADELTTGTATSSRSITAKVLGDYVKGKTNDKISSLSINGNVITYTKGDGTTGTITTPNTTYSAGSGLTLSGTTLSVNTNGIATSGNAGVVSGGTLYNAIKDKVQYDSDDKSKISFGGTRGTVLSNLLGTTITADSTNAVTGAQLYAVKQDIAGFATDINKHDETIRALNTSVTSALSSVAASGLLVDTMDASKADASLNNLTEAGKNILKQYASDAVQEYVAAQGLSSPIAPVAPIAPSNTNDNTLTVTNAGNGSLHVGEGSYVNGTSSIAIGVGNQVNANNSGAFGDPSIINADESYVLGNDDTINTGATGSFIVGNDGVSDAKGGLLFGSNTIATVHAENGIALGNHAEVSAKNAIALGSGSIADTENTVSIGNENLKRKITNVADGAITEDSHEVITGAQLFVTNQKVQKNTEAISNKADADAGNINVSDWSSKLGIGYVEDGDTNLVTGGTVYNAVKEIKDNTLVQSNGNFITIGKNDVSSKIDVTNSNGEGRVITGVMTDIDDATSVANVGYVTQIGENIIKATNNAFQRVDTKINKAGANAAAIANLPTPTFEGEEKWAFAAGVGHYQGETAGAVGAFYRPNDNVIARVSGSFGNGDEMVGAGVAVSLNKGNTPMVSKAQLVRTINAQAERINVQDSQINAQNERINNMELSHKAEIDAVRAENAELKAMIADLAAKIK